MLADRAQQNTPGLIMWEAAPVVIPLLRLAVQQRLHAPFAAHVIQLLGSHAATTSGAQPVVISETGEALTARELDVLRLLAAGYSNRAIGRALVVELGTVKRHVNSLMGKLQVQSRLQAVTRARELNLV